MKTKQTLHISNRLAAIREQRAISASELASMVGISRQTVYAVEAGSYIPNTAIGLRLARALGVAMEELFSIEEQPLPSKPRPQKATLLPQTEELQPGQAVQLCKVNGKLVAATSAPSFWYLPPSDGAIMGSDPVRGTARIDADCPDADLENRLLLAGCDPAMGMLARYLQHTGIELVLLHQNSSQSLSLLKTGYTHVAGSHLGDSNAEAVNRMFPSKSAALISFATWQEGLVTAHGNPKHIKGVQELARKDVSFINREIGSGSRALLDRSLKQFKLGAQDVRGYSRTAPGHLAAAWEVKTGTADCCLTTEISARFFGLHFIPLESVRYDLVLRKQQLATKGIQTLLDSITELKFRRQLGRIGGYDSSVTGTRIQ